MLGIRSTRTALLRGRLFQHGSLRFPSKWRNSSEAKTKQTQPANTNDLLLHGSATQSLGTVTRHGAGDACIVLNVGGTEFITLRSTVAQNPVLSDHVARAEANKELMQSTAHKSVSAVFIDRDGTHFAFILQYLRNQVEVEHANLLQQGDNNNHNTMGVFTAFHTKSCMPQLPTDGKVLAELYVEAVYYGLTELQTALRDRNTWTKILSMLGLSKQGNPFVRASQLVTQARMMLVTLGTVTAGGIVSGTEAMNQFLEWCGWKTAKKEGKDEQAVLALEGSNKQNPVPASS